MSEPTSSQYPHDVPSKERCIVDGVVVNEEDVWVLLGRRDDDPVEILLGEHGVMSDAPLRICRAVLGDGKLIIGAADDDQDRLLSDLLRREDCGNA